MFLFFYLSERGNHRRALSRGVEWSPWLLPWIRDCRQAILETRQDARTIIQAGADCDLNQDGSSGGAYQWWALRLCFLTTVRKSWAFVGNKRKKGIKDDFKVWTRATGRMQLPFTKMSIPAGRAESIKAMVLEVINLRFFSWISKWRCRIGS